MSETGKSDGKRPRTVADALRESRGGGSKQTRGSDADVKAASGSAAAAGSTTAASSSGSTTSGSTRPSGTTTSRRTSSSESLSAAEYARTTHQSSDTTSVMPAIKDDGPAPAGAPTTAGAAARSRQARLRLQHIEPWSVTRLAFVVSVAMMIVAVVAVTIFWVVLDLTGIWDGLNGTISNVLSDSADSFDLTDYLGLGRLVGLTLVFSAVNVVLMTILATIAAHLYNLAAQLLGGIEVTFGED